MDSINQLLVEIGRLSEGIAVIPNASAISALRERLQDTYCRWELVQSEPLQESLRASQFRAWLNTDRELRVPTVLGDRFWILNEMFGFERLYAMVQFCQDRGEEENWYRIGANEYSRGRGLMQAMADLVFYAATGESEFWESLVRRVWAGYRKRPSGSLTAGDYDREFFEMGYEPPKKWSLIASVPPKMLIDLVLELLRLPEEGEG